MAVFGPQLIYTVIMFVLLSKLGRFYSIGRYILCTKLFRYLSPNSDDIKKSVRKFYNSSTGKNKKLSRLFEIDDKKEEFNIPEGAEIELACSSVVEHELYYIKYSDDLQSFIDISFIALFIYVTTEIYVAFVNPTDEINLSVVWCGMALVYGFFTLSSIAYNYMKTDEGILLYMFAAFSFMISMLIQLADTKFFEFKLKDAYQNVTSNTLSLLQAHIEINSENGNLKDNEPSSSSTADQTKQFFLKQLKTYSNNDILFTCFIALISSYIGAILFFPSFRMARLHILCLKHESKSKMMRLVFYLNFLMPLIISLCWLKTGSNISKSSQQNNSNVLLENEDNKVAAEFLSAIIVNDSLNTQNITGVANAQQIAREFIYNFLMANNLKVYLIVTAFLIRMILYRHYAQAYLNVALELAVELRQSATRITNTRYMSTISSIYQYYGVVASQYIIPLFCLLFLSLLFKTLGDLSWCGNSVICNEHINSVLNYTASFKVGYKTSPSFFKTMESGHFNMTLSHNALKEIFSVYVLRSIFGYFTFWTAFIWFSLSSIGLIYYQYIDKQY